ncbi:hypothetical protein [Cohnella nanjingensis]|nr:hypothetical protein [Cohnella nanjingensis]
MAFILKVAWAGRIAIRSRILPFSSRVTFNDKTHRLSRRGDEAAYA